MSRSPVSIRAAVFIGGLVFSCFAAQAETCDAGIARWEGILAKARAERAPAIDAPESTAATMHRQPTAASVANAETQTNTKAEEMLENAKKQRSEGKPRECVRTLDALALEAAPD